MEIRVLRYFLEVAREESITRAAKRLHISQPTLSKQLKDLESELGKKLFVRSSFSVHLTDEGMLLRKRAEDILDMVDKTAEEFKALGQVAGGNIHIGCAESEGIKYLARRNESIKVKLNPPLDFVTVLCGLNLQNEVIDHFPFAVYVQFTPMRHIVFQLLYIRLFAILQRGKFA